MLKELTYQGKPFGSKGIKEIRKGVYLTDLNFVDKINRSSDFRVVNDSEMLVDVLNDNVDRLIERYGVCDNEQQILDYIPEILSDDKMYVISLTSFKKELQPYSGGWKWSKWGDYIGTQNKQEEYLKYEPEIEEVYVYHVYEIQSRR